jgi:hypothetical protein
VAILRWSQQTRVHNHFRPHSALNNMPPTIYATSSASTQCHRQQSADGTSSDGGITGLPHVRRGENFVAQVV